MSSRTASLLIVAALAVAAMVRLHALPAASFEPEEIAGLDAAERLLGVDGTRASAGKSNAVDTPAPVAVLISVLALRSGHGEFIQRLPGVAAGIGTVVAAGVLAADGFGAEAAVYAVVGLACSPAHVAASRSAGAEVWVALLASVTALLFVRALRIGGRVRAWLAFAVAAVLMCGSGYTGLFPLAGMTVYALAARRRPPLRGAAWRAYAACGVAAVVGGGVVWRSTTWPGPSLFPLRMGVQLPADVGSLLASGRRQMAAGGMLLLLCAAVGVVRASGRPPGAGVCGAWFVAALLGTVVTDVWLGLELRPEQLAVALPAYFVLIGAGMSWLRQAAARVGMGHTDAVVRYGLVCLLLAVEAPALWAYLRQAPPPWRDAAAVVDANARAADGIVVLNDRRRFLFYAPDLQRRASAVTRPGLAPVFFVHPARAWLVAPTANRLYPGWQRVREWFQRFPPVNLSPGSGVDVFYVGRGGRTELLQDVAYFELPTSVLVRGTLLLDVLKESGPILPVLWKVDQIALSHEPLDFHNPQLLSVAAYLADKGFTDRALSLAYRLVTADPGWAEARQALKDLTQPPAKAG